jgi:4-carboxymuconolactone decarboxylase
LEDTKMRLPLLPPSSLSGEQKALYEDIMGVVKESFGSFIAAREDGALIGPFNAMLHFPAFGRAAWAMNKTMYERTTLPKSVLQVAVLVTGTRLGARDQSYGHEPLAERAGVPTAKIATIVAGERPTDLTRDETVAYDVAAALNRGGPLPKTISQAGIDAFGKEGMAEILCLVGCFHLVGVLLNGYDVPVPGRGDAR